MNILDVSAVWPLSAAQRLRYCLLMSLGWSCEPWPRSRYLLRDPEGYTVFFGTLATIDSALGDSELVPQYHCDYEALWAAWQKWSPNCRWVEIQTEPHQFCLQMTAETFICQICLPQSLPLTILRAHAGAALLLTYLQHKDSQLHG